MVAVVSTLFSVVAHVIGLFSIACLAFLVVSCARALLFKPHRVAVPLFLTSPEVQTVLAVAGTVYLAWIDGLEVASVMMNILIYSVSGLFGLALGIAFLAACVCLLSWRGGMSYFLTDTTRVPALCGLVAFVGWYAFFYQQSGIVALLGIGALAAFALSSAYFHFSSARWARLHHLT